MTREIIFYGEYFMDFYVSVNFKTQLKIDYVLKLVSSVEVVPEKFLKHISGTEGLYELRIKQGSDIYRVFCFFDNGKLIVLVNGFVKKSQKTPRIEIRKALRLKVEYLKTMRNEKES